jgi:hypothetical protein
MSWSDKIIKKLEKHKAQGKFLEHYGVPVEHYVLEHDSEFDYDEIVKDLHLPKDCDQQHTCSCGGVQDSQAHHPLGEGRCLRKLTTAPILAKKGILSNTYFVGELEVTEHTLHRVLLYDQHPCGCWSRPTIAM